MAAKINAIQRPAMTNKAPAGGVLPQETKVEQLGSAQMPLTALRLSAGENSTTVVNSQPVN